MNQSNQDQTMCQNDNLTDSCVAHSSQISRQNGRNMFVEGGEVNLSHEKYLLGTLKGTHQVRQNV